MQAFPVLDPSEVAQARRGIAALATKIGFGEADVARAALVATELATNLVKHARDGQLLAMEAGIGTDRSLLLLALDTGPGMEPARCMIDGFSSAGSPGTGLGAIRRMSESIDIYSRPGMGTGICVRLLPRPGKVVAADSGIDLGCVVAPKPGEAVSGDAWASAEEGSERLSLLVVDGLGHGLHAAEAAREAVRVFATRQPLDPAPMMQALHAALRPTRGAAAAIADIDFRGGCVVYSGLGNISASLVTGDTVKRMISDNGILGHRASRIRQLIYPAARDTAIVLHSDGLSANWQLKEYPGLVARSAALIAGILYRDFQRRRDDALVLVAKRRAA